MEGENMNNKGFSLVELLGCMVLLVLIFGIGLYSARGTLATSDDVLNQVSNKEIEDAAKMYVLEYPVTWNNNDIEYTCVTIRELVDAGYFEDMEVEEAKNKEIKIVRNKNTKVIENTLIVDECE